MTEKPKSTNFHRMTRAEFLRAIVYATGGSILAACAPGTAISPDDTPLPDIPTPTPQPTTKLEEMKKDTAATATSAPAPSGGSDDSKKYGGVWRASVGDDVPTLDGPACNWIDWWATYAIVYSRLYDWDENFKPYPDLAEDFPEISDDGLIYRIMLKKGVKFHNGRELKAEDVKFTIDRAFARGYMGCGAGKIAIIKGAADVQALEGDKQLDFVDLEGTKVIDDYTLQIELTTPDNTLPYFFTTNGGNIVPKKESMEAKDKWGTEVVIGTGPFKLKEWRPGEVVIFEKHTEFHKPGLPYLDELEIYLNLAPEASQIRFEKREIDYFLMPPVENAKRLLQDPVFKEDVRYSDAAFWAYMMIALNKGVFTDVRMRQALCMGIDKEAMCAISGGSQVPYDQAYTPQVLQYDPDFKFRWAYNPEEAAKIVKELYPNGVKVKGWLLSLGVEQMQIMQEDLKKIGIDLELVQGEYGQNAEASKTGDIDLIAFGAAYDVYDASTLAYTEWYCDPNNANRWERHGDCDSKQNDLVTKAKELPLLSEERTRVLRELQDYVINERVWFIPMRLSKMLDFYAQYVKDIRISIALMPWVERAWIDKEQFEKVKSIKPIS
jgi:ABC-type transport system substrate-binding protein